MRLWRITVIAAATVLASVFLGCGNEPTEGLSRPATAGGVTPPVAVEPTPTSTSAASPTNTLPPALPTATVPLLTATPLFTPPPTSTTASTPTPAATPTPEPTHVPTPTPAPTVTLVPTATSLPAPTHTPAPVPARAYLYDPISPPMAPTYMVWRWEEDQEGFRELITDFTIHNDVGDWSDDHGYYLILLSNDVSGVGFYFGVQTDANGRGKGLIYSRWETRDLANARYSESDGWTQSSGHEGDFIGVRRNYDWGTGDYRVRIAPDDLEEDGEWFGLWITDLATDETTWIGSLKFPLTDGNARMEPHSIATIELYGIPEVRPIDIPRWHVSVSRPLGDGKRSEWGFTRYPFDDSENALFNSDVRYDQSEGRAHLIIGELTERDTPEEVIDFP